MRWTITCRQAATWLLQRAERRPTLWARLSLRLHLAICPPCAQFERQVRLMNAAMGRWRAYRADEPPEPPSA